MTEKENYLKTVRFEKPDHIPMTFCINSACWQRYPQDFLLEQMERHPRLFDPASLPRIPYQPEFANVARKDHPYTDDFGCRWETTEDGITGTVVAHPLGDWENFSGYQAPNPDLCSGIGAVDWEALRREIQNTPEILHVGQLRHGHTFLQLCDLRGYENLMFDMADEEPLLWELIDLVENFNQGIVRHFLDCRVDVMAYAEDLGMQTGPMVSPEHFRKYIKPSYERLIRPAREKGLPIHMHSDGDIRTLASEIIDGGVEILNLQDLVNGIDWIRENLAGKTCIELDIDRQKITRFGTPAQIHSLIREEVEKLGSPSGGLMMIFGLYPGTPLENVQAVMDAMEGNMDYFR